MSATPVNTVSDQLAQLEKARTVVLSDATFYPQIVVSILSIIGVTAGLELRQWGANFLAETFANPVFKPDAKQKLSQEVVGVLKDFLENPEEDADVIKSTIQTAASIYPFIFKSVVEDPSKAALWEEMAAIKQSIFQRWSHPPYSVRICCVKFAQKVVQIQTLGSYDPRRPEQNEISLAIVPKNHPVLTLPHLEAEATGLLDRLLDVLYENSSDPILVNATLNCLSVLIRTRQTISSRIMFAVLGYNPLKNCAGQPITQTLRVNIRSIERTTRSLLINLLKRNPSHPMNAKIQQYIEKLAQSSLETLNETPRKRPAPAEPTDVVDPAKRAKLGADDNASAFRAPPLPPGPNSVANLFTLTEDKALSAFDVTQLPADLVVPITIAMFSKINQSVLGQAIAAVKNRYEMLSKRQVLEVQKSNAQAASASRGDEDDYEPEYEPGDLPMSIEPTSSAATQDAPLVPSNDTTAAGRIGPFKLHQPPPLTETQAADLGKETVSRTFHAIPALVQASSSPMSAQADPSANRALTLSPSATDSKPGFTRLAGSSFDRDSWLTILMRLATRAPVGLAGEDDSEWNGNKTSVSSRRHQQTSISDSIREMLFRYILEDFRGYIPVAIAWLNEEWYNDQIQLRAFSRKQQTNGNTSNETPSEMGDQTNEEQGEQVSVKPVCNYATWSLRLLEGILPYLDAKDKVLIRFLGEIPELNDALIAQVKVLANDPERVSLCVNTFYYLVLTRPPVRQKCLDALEDLYTNVEEARPLITKIFTKWRPDTKCLAPAQ